MVNLNRRSIQTSHALIPASLTWEKLRCCWVHCAVGGLLAIPLRHRSLQLAQHWFEQTWIYPPTQDAMVEFNEGLCIRWDAQNVSCDPGGD